MKRSSTLAFVLMATFPFPASASPPPVPSPEATTPDSSDQLTIAVNPTVPRADNIRQALEASGRTLLTSTNRPLAGGDRIIVQVSGEQYDYRIQTLATRHELEVDEETMICKCSDTELNESVDAEISRAAKLLGDTPVKAEGPSTPRKPEQGPVPKLPSRQLVPTPENSPEPVGPIPHATAPEPMQQEHTARQTRIASVATLIAGSALLFAGAGMMGAGSSELLDDWPLYERNWRPLGFTLGGLGLAGMAVGGSLLIVDDIRCRRRPDSCTSRKHAKRREFARLVIGSSR